MSPLLEVQNLSIGFGAEPPVVSSVNFTVNPGGTLAIVGESGSGKNFNMPFHPSYFTRCGTNAQRYD